MTIRNDSTQFLISVFFSVLAVALNYLITLVLTPYITENIGTEAYGFVSLGKAFANYASIITVALNSFASRYISVEYHKGNYDKANKYFNSVLFADIGLGIVILIISLVIILNLQHFLSIPESLIYDVKCLFLLDSINFFILSCCTAFMSATIIKNRLELSSIIKGIAYISEATFLVIAFKLLSPKVQIVGWGLVISSLIILLLYIIVSKKYTPELRIDVGIYSWGAIKNILKNGIWNSVNSLGNTLNTGLDLLITNIMLSALKAGQLAIVKTISTIILTLFQLIAQPFQPLQLKYYAKDDKEKLIESFILGIKVNGMISNIAFAGFVIFGSAYYRLWTPGEDIKMLQSITIITVLGSIIEGAVYPLYYVYTLTLRNKVPCIVTLISGLLNVVFMYMLIKLFNLGIFAVAGTSALLSWIVNFIFNPIYSAHCLNISKWTFYPTLLRHIFSCALITVVFYVISIIYFPNTWVTLVIIALISAFIGIIIHSTIVFTIEEKKLLLEKLFKKGLSL